MTSQSERFPSSKVSLVLMEDGFQEDVPFPDIKSSVYVEPTHILPNTPRLLTTPKTTETAHVDVTFYC